MTEQLSGRLVSSQGQANTAVVYTLLNNENLLFKEWH